MHPTGFASLRSARLRVMRQPLGGHIVRKGDALEFSMRLLECQSVRESSCYVKKARRQWTKSLQVPPLSLGAKCDVRRK